MSVYLVLGDRPYRNHEPGTLFEANLDGHAERRAINRGNIILVARSTPSLVPGSYKLPQATR